MRHASQWKPSKYVQIRGKLRASRDPKEVSVGSRLISDLIAEFYGRALSQHARGRLLDLGCGRVPLYGAYRDLVSEAVCVDWANSLHKNPHLDLEMDLTQPLPYADGAFDTLILSDVLEHIPSPEQLWREMARVLAPGGKLLLNVPFYYWLHEQPHDYYRFTEFALRRFAETSGMTLLELQPIGGAPEVVTDVFSKNVHRVPIVGPSIAEASEWFTAQFVRTRLGGKISRGTGPSFPLGYVLVAQKPETARQA